MGQDQDGAADLATATSERVRALLDEATSLRVHDQFAARDVALRARVQARAEDDKVGEAEALYLLASIAHNADDPDDAFALAIESADIAAAADAPLVESWAAHLIGIVHYQASNYSEALEHCLRALELYRRADHEGDESTILNTVASVYSSIGDTDRAIVTYESALAVSEPRGHGAFSAVVYGNIARIRAQRSEYLPAVSLGVRAVELARQHAPEIVSNLLADLAEAYMGLADPAQAAMCFAEARRIWEQNSAEGSDPPASTQLGVMTAEGRVAMQRGALDEAIGVLQAALDLAISSENVEFELEVNDLLAQVFKRCGRFEEALERRERHDAQYRAMFTDATDLRLRTLQVAHESAVARQRAEIFRLRSSELTGSSETRSGGHAERAPVDPVDAGDHDFGDLDLGDPAAVQLDAFERLAILAEFRDADTGQHTKRVGDMAAEIAHALGEVPDWCERLRLAARLHDIGKVAVPDAVLLKTGPLTIDEFDLMKTHTTVGHQILAGSSSPLFELAAQLALTHHEWWDGSGYPYGRRREEIPLSGRIVAIADVFDALCSKRVYKRAWPMDEAARFVVSGRDVQFDPEVVDAFVTVLLAQHPELEPDLR